MKKLFKSKTFLGAVLSISLCVSLIAGATFAIFTSESKVNIAVTSGKVNVTATVDNLRLYSLDNIDLATLTGTEVDRTEEGTFINGGTAGLTGNALSLDKLTPGDRVTFDVNIANNSNVTVKYRMRISIADDTGLANQLNIKIGDYTGRYVTIWEELAPGEGNQTLACEIALPAASTVQDKSCTISLLAEAVQGNAAVSNDEHYPATAAGLKEAMQYGGKVFMEKDVAIDPVVEDTTVSTLVPQTTVSNDTTIDLNGKTISVKYDETTDFGHASPVLIAVMSGKLTLNGNGGINCEAGDQQVYGINVNGGSVVINGGNYYGAITAVQVQKGSLEINGGFFDMAPTCKAQVPQYAKYVVNCIDAAYQNGTATITIKGGTFVNFDPSANPEGAGTSYVADGYSVISEEQANGDVWYTVVKGTSAVVGTQEDLTKTITENTTATVKLNVAGTYTLPSQNVDNKDITIIGTKDTVIDLTTGFAAHGSTISLEGVTVQGQTSGNFQGLQHTAKVVYKNCVITGKQTLYANDVEFIGCKFSGGTDYALWTYGAKNVTFTDCEFESGDNSKAVLCYSVLKDQTFTRTFNNCKFTAIGTADKSAIMINPTESSGGTNTYIVNINNCTATGYAENGIAGYTIVGLRNAGAGVIDTITVNIDGATVYTH